MPSRRCGIIVIIVAVVVVCQCHRGGGGVIIEAVVVVVAHRRRVASLNSMPASSLGRRHRGNKSAVGLVWESEVVRWE